MLQLRGLLALFNSLSRRDTIGPQLLQHNAHKPKTTLNIKNKVTKRRIYNDSHPNLERPRIQTFLLRRIDPFHLLYYIFKFLTWGILIAIFNYLNGVLELIFTFIKNSLTFIVLNTRSEGDVRHRWWIYAAILSADRSAYHREGAGEGVASAAVLVILDIEDIIH